MMSLKDYYQTESKFKDEAPSWFLKLQEEALDLFKTLGFPLRKDEEWKYSSLDDFFKQSFTAIVHKKAYKQPALSLPYAPQVEIINGQIFINDKVRIPEGVIVKPLLEVLKSREDLIKPYLGKILTIKHGFHALNLSALNTGLFIYIPESLKLTEPLILAHWHDEANQALHSRHLIVAEAQSQATILQSFHGAEGLCYFGNRVTEVYLGEGATLAHYNLQEESKEAYHISHTAVSEAAKSKFSNQIFNFGSKFSRSDLTMELQASEAECFLSGLYFPTDKQHMDHNILVHHKVAECKSEQNYKGVLSGASRAVFSGKILVAKDALHTEASQQNKNLLLSSLAEIDTKPQLEIFADDVRCSHGATVGQLDEETLFYMATRGFSKEEASLYLIQAFAKENLAFIPDSKLATWIAALISKLYLIGENNE